MIERQSQLRMGLTCRIARAFNVFSVYRMAIFLLMVFKFRVINTQEVFQVARMQLLQLAVVLKSNLPCPVHHQ